MNRLLVAFFITLSTGLGLAQSVFAQQPSPEQMQKWRDEAMEKKKRIEAELNRGEDEFWARSLPMVLAPAPPSPWLEAERNFYAELVALAKPRVIVIPPTVAEGDAGIDISSRITIARLLAAALEPAAGPILDPGLVYRALGESRSLSNAAIRQKFYRTSAEWFIVGSVKRDGGRLWLTFTRIPARAPGDAEATPAFKLEGIELGVEPPELVLAKYVADAVAALGYKPGDAQGGIAKASPLVLPASIAEPIKSDPSTLEGVWLQQLLGVLQIPYAQSSERARERVFERTLAALIALPKNTPDRAVLLARSLAYLDRREAALKVLSEGSGTAEGKAFASYLAGDLPALQAAVARITRPAAKLIAELELFRLRDAFGAVSDGALEETANTLAATAPAAWRELIAVHVIGSHLWTLPSSASLKPLLDKTFPVAGYSLEDMVRGKAALGARGVEEKVEVELLLSPISHASKWREANAKDLCCHGSGAGLRQVDRSQVLDLIEADTERLALARLEFLAKVQGVPQRMRRLADLYDEVLFRGGHPGVAMQRMEASYWEGNRSPPDRGRLWPEAFENSRRVLSWEPGQGVPTANALAVRRHTYLQYLSSPTRIYRELPPHPVERDVPLRSLWAGSAERFVGLDRIDFALATERDACVNTVIYFSVCERYVKGLTDAKRKAEVGATVDALIVPRFKGSTQRLQFLAAMELEKGNVAAARKLLQEAVALPYAPQDAYSALGKLLLGEGEIAFAGAVYARFPGLKDSNQGSVGISNYAGEAGYTLVRLGATQDGLSLLERAAANGDGSYASLWSAGQLALMKADYRGSLDMFRRAYQRYGSPGPSRAIVSLLFVTGQREAAWSALGEILPASQEFSPFRAAPVGLRMVGSDDKALMDWYDNTTKMLRPAPGGRFARTEFVVNAFLQTILIDREAGAYDPLIEAIYEQNFVRNWKGNGPPLPRAERKFTLPDNSIFGPQGALYHNAYEAFRRNNHAAAIEAWGKLVASFDVNAYPPTFGDKDGEAFWSGMPYYAISLVKSGRAAEASKLAERLTRDGRPAGAPKIGDHMEQVPMPEFDRRMIAGIVAAYAGDHAKAQRLLRGAQGSMAEPGVRVLPPEYAFVEILELLAKDTGQRAYLTMALEFAKAFRQYEPWAAWAYAFEAAYLSGADQQHAAAIALKLDPKSMRLKRVDAGVLQRAREDLSRHDPFLAKPPPKGRAQPTT